jgi:hypothetical protein
MAIILCSIISAKTQLIIWHLGAFNPWGRIFTGTKKEAQTGLFLLKSGE